MAAKKSTDRSWDKKWSRKIGDHGYSVVPNILFWFAADLGLKPAHQAVLFNLLSRWWEADNPPIVSKAKMAEGLGITERQVQRYLRELEKLGLITASFPNKPGRHPNEYRFDGLVNKLNKVAEGYAREKRQKTHHREERARKAAQSRD